MILIPLQAVPSQTLAIPLSQQPAQIAVRQNGRNVFFDLISANIAIVRTRICRDRSRLLLDAGYRGFQGDFAFIDTQGTSDPVFTGLGTRYQLFYLGVGE